jgi:hypothetical protein
MRPLLKDADVVIPLAALVGAPLCDHDAVGAETTNVGAVKLLVNLASRAQRFIIPITNSGYGIGEKGKFCTEDSPLKPISLYGQTKVAAEKAVLGDALIAPNVPPSFRAGDPRIRRLFKDCRASVTEYFRKTKVFPITHTVVLRESLIDKHPWIVNSLVNAFAEAERLCRKAYEYPKRLAFPTAVLMLEEEEETFGKEPFQHGLTPQNQVVLEKFLQYAEEQGYIACQPKLNDLFAPVGN